MMLTSNCLLAICISSLVKCLFKSFVHFLIGFFSAYYCYQLFKYFIYKSFIDRCLQIFSLIYTLFFHSLNSIFSKPELLNFNDIQFNFFFLNHSFDVSRNSVAQQHEEFLLSPKSFIILAFTFRNMTCF